MSKRYQKKNPLDHILLRPDMYVGSTRLRSISEYVAHEDKNNVFSISKQDVISSPAILRIFIEPLSNAIDNVERSSKTSTPSTKIMVSIDPISGKTTIWNDGDIVPIEMDSEEKCYNHSMIFGQLLTGSNYDDEKERVLSGRNGLGVKLTNVFSSSFSVKGCDPKNKATLFQEWTENMKNTNGPVVKKSAQLKGFTEVSWTPDFEKLGLKNGYTDDIIKLYTRFVIDAAMLSKVKVYLNKEIVRVTNLREYSSLYSTPTDEKMYIKTKNAEVIITTSKEYETVSFVNGVYTRLGGQHVDSWSESLLRPIVEKFNSSKTKGKSNPKINISDVKQFFRIFVVSTIVRPEFDGQDKNKLESPAVTSNVKPSYITAITKWSVMDNIEEIIRFKEMVVLKKAERVSKKTKIEGLDQANKAGGKDGYKCSLFICEGLSAKTYVVAGIDEGVYSLSGRDWFGILPVTGKVLNVRNSTATSIAANKVICNLIHALGLKHGIDYKDESNYKKLNYGRVIIIADADVDGIHIEGLILNVIHSLYPSLLEREKSFVVSMKTPIARVIKKRGTDDILFYDENNFNSWLENQERKINIKYYKGLGTTKSEDVPDTFGLKMVEYKNDEDAFSSMQKAFHNKHADSRKEWLKNYNPREQKFSLDKVGCNTNMSISDFINTELIKFSHADCSRSIPNGIDGLKESQRKLLYSVKKRRLKYSGKSLKVAQLAGYTAEHSNYHHGEKNLFDTIIGMANEFPGTNNIPLLYRDGMFGTRLEGANDAADGRYIFTKMDALTELIYREEDEPLLDLVNDDGDLVQPEHYIPIIPMALVNGCIAGIGTGWSSTIPCFNPLDLIKAIKVWIKNDGEVLLEDPNDKTNIVSLFDDISPWYRGFKGDIEKSSDSRYVTYGIVMERNRGVVEVTELPVGMWTSKFRDFVDTLKSDKKLKKVQDYSNPKNVSFFLTEEQDFRCDLKTLKLHSYLYTSNMVMFDENNKLQKYKNIDEVLANFCRVRFSYYVKRKVHQVKTLEAELRFLKNKERFVTEVINKTLIIMNTKETDVIKKLTERKYDEDPKRNEDQGGYDYLLRLPVRNLTTEKIHNLKKEINSIQNKLIDLKNTSEKHIWLNELNEFEKSYKIWLKDIETQNVKSKKKH